jgi:hypothetical protein
MIPTGLGVLGSGFLAIYVLEILICHGKAVPNYMMKDPTWHV